MRLLRLRLKALVRLYYGFSKTVVKLGCTKAVVKM